MTGKRVKSSAGIKIFSHCAPGPESSGLQQGDETKRASGEVRASSDYAESTVSKLAARWPECTLPGGRILVLSQHVRNEWAKAAAGYQQANITENLAHQDCFIYHFA